MLQQTNLSEMDYRVMYSISLLINLVRTYDYMRIEILQRLELLPLRFIFVSSMPNLALGTIGPSPAFHLRRVEVLHVIRNLA